MNIDKLLGMLLEAIDYCFLQSNGDYDKSLTYPVIDKVKYIKDKLKNKEVEEDAVHGTVDYPLVGCDFPNIYPNYKELKEYCDRKGIKDNDKVKLIIIKDM